MRKFTKIIVGLVIIIIVAGVFIGFNKNKNNNSETGVKTYKIGIIAPLTGDLAYFGADFVNGVKVVLDEVAAKGEKMEIIVEDSKFDVPAAVSAYQKMASVDKPDVIFSFGNGADEALIPLADKDAMPLLLTFSSASGLPAKSEWVFRYFTNADTDGPVMAKYAAEQLGLKTVGILYVQDGFGVDLNKTFTQNFEQMGGNVVAAEPIQYTEYSYKTQLTKIQAANPEAIYLIGQDFQNLIALKEIKELGFQGKILSVGTIATKQTIDKAAGNAEGVYLTAFCTDGTPEGYKEKFRTKYNQDPGFMGELGYDMIKFVDMADGNGSASKEELSKNLLKIKDYQTNSGLVSSSADGEIIIPLCPKVIRDGKIFNLTTNRFSNY